jgi:hypothetical protein
MGEDSVKFLAGEFSQMSASAYADLGSAACGDPLTSKIAAKTGSPIRFE